MGIKNIFLLDMDETLLDFQRAERVNLTQSLAKFGISVGEELAARFHEINDSLWKALERGEITRERLKARRFEILYEEFGFSGDPAEAALAYWKNFPFVCFPFDGALEFLKALALRGRVYLVTNGGSVIQRRHIKDAGFEPYLSGIFISEEVGVNKPSVAYADYVESHIENYDRASAVWIGDSLSSDGKCAESRGIDFILYARGGAPEGYRGNVAKNYRQVLDLLFN